MGVFVSQLGPSADAPGAGMTNPSGWSLDREDRLSFGQSFIGRLVTAPQDQDIVGPVVREYGPCNE